MSFDNSPPAIPSTRARRGLRWPVFLFAASWVLWMVAGFLNVSLTPGAAIPWGAGSLLGVEWAAVGVLLLLACGASWRRPALGGAIGISLMTLTLVDLAFTLGPFTGDLGFPRGAIFMSGSLLTGVAASIWDWSLSRSARALTRPSVLATVVASVPAIAWAIAWTPSWWVTNYSVVGAKFSSTGTDHMSIPNGNTLTGGAFEVITGLLILLTPLLLVMWASLWSDVFDRLWVFLTCGVFLISIAADSLWQLGTFPRANAPHWWGWSYHGQISTVATPWLWISLFAGVALVFDSVVTAAWSRTATRESVAS